MKLPPDRTAYLRALCRTVPFPIVERVLASPSEMSITAQRFGGSILHADLVGFTALCERAAAAGPQSLSRLTDLLNGFFTRLLEGAVFPFGGWVIQFGGDSLTVIFRGEQAEVRAATAALAMRQTLVGETTAGVTEKPGDLQLRVGVASGTIQLAVIGDFSHRIVVCAASTVHRAVRLQSRAAPGSVHVDDATRAVLLQSGVAPDLLEHAEDDSELLAVGVPPAQTPLVNFDSLIQTSDVEAAISLLEPFVPVALAGRLKSAPSGWRMEGELRPVVILFLEVTRFDAPNRSAEWQLGISRSLTRAFRKYGGIVAKADASEEGHRIMVLFGLHMPSGNDAERAMLAALEGMARVRAFLAQESDTAAARAGIHTGTVYFGTFGSDVRHDTTVVGDAVNTAARTARAAAPFEVLVTAEALEDSGNMFQTTPRAPIRVKGKSEPLALHTLNSPKEGVAHYARRRTNQRHLAGREKELERALEILRMARAGDAQFLGISGEEGAGKSALLSRLIDGWVESGGIAMVGRCRYANRSEPLAPVSAMFSSYLGITSSDGESQRRERIREGLKPFGILNEGEEFLALLEPVRRPDGQRDSLVDLSDAYARERVLATILRFVDQRVAEEPLLYVIEDLHLADSLTLDLMMRTMMLDRKRPFLLVVTYRPEPMLTLFRQGLGPDRELILPPLTLEGVEALVAAQLRATSVEPKLLSFFMDRAHGNPANTVDMVRFLAERSLLAVRGGQVLPPEGGMALLDDVVPRGATHVALAHLDMLGEVERRLARTASVIGRSFSRELLEQVSTGEIDNSRVGEALDALLGQAVLADEGRQFAFRDDVTRAVAYGTLPQNHREDLHRRVADALEQRPDLSVQRDAAAIASHRERAGQFAEAAHWYELAAEAALGSGLAEETRQRVTRWEECSRKARPTASARRRARMQLLRIVALGKLRLSRRLLDSADALEASEREALEPMERKVLQFWTGFAHARTGAFARACALLTPVYESAHDDSLRREAAMEIAQTRILEGRAPEALTWLGRAEGVAGGEAAALSRIELLRLEVLATRGDADRELARQRLVAIRNEAFESRRLEVAARAARAVGRLELGMRRFEEAQQAAREAFVYDRALGRWLNAAMDQLLLGEALLWDGRAEEAREPLEAALTSARESGDRVLETAVLSALGTAVALTRDPPEGARLAEEGEARGQALGLAPLTALAHLRLLSIARIRKDAAAEVAWRSKCEAEQEYLSTPLLRTALQSYTVS